MGKPKLLFGDIVVVEKDQVGVVVKTWITTRKGVNTIQYEVYVRGSNGIKTYPEGDIERYAVRHKELNEEEIGYQEALH